MRVFLTYVPAHCKYNFSITDQGECHAHDDRREDEVEGGDTQQVAVRVWVCVDIFILSGQHKIVSMAIFHLGLLKIKESKANCNSSVLAVNYNQHQVIKY